MNGRVKEYLTTGKLRKSSIIYSAPIEAVIDKISKESKMPIGEIKKIVDSQFRALRLVMSAEGDVTPDSNFEDFKSIRLMRLGSFRPSEPKFKHIQEWIENKKEKKN